MEPAAALAASVLDASPAALSSAVAQALAERGTASLEDFRAHMADLRVRLQALAEAVALERAGLYLHHVEWLRTTYRARGLPEQLLSDTALSLADVLREALPPQAFSAVEPILAAERALLASAPQHPETAPATAQDPRVAELLELVLQGRREAALRIALGQAESTGSEAFVESVLVPLQRELGRLWQAGAIHVGDEHLGSRVTEEILARLSARADEAPALGLRVVVAATAGDLHDIGARMIALQLERAGWEVLFLGANVPTRDLVLSLRDQRADLLALSVSQCLHARGAAATVAAAHAAEPRVPVLVGGPPFLAVPDLWRVIGADAQASGAAEACRAALALVRPERAPRAAPGGP